MGTCLSSKIFSLPMETWVWAGVSLLYYHSSTQEQRRYRVRNADLRNCRRTQESHQHHQDCRRLLGSWCLYKTCAAGSTFSPVNHDCKRISPVQTACLVERCWSTLIWVCWASTDLEGVGRSVLQTQLEPGRLRSFSLDAVQGEAACVAWQKWAGY